MYASDLDLRDQWLGLKFLRRNFTPAPYHRCTTNKQHVPMPLRAQSAADFLASEQWHPPLIPNPTLPSATLAPNLQETDYNTSDITLT